MFTKEGDFFRKDPKTDRFFTDPGELADLYKDWEILEPEGPQEEKLAADGKSKNIGEEILARKPHSVAKP